MVKKLFDLISRLYIFCKIYCYYSIKNWYSEYDILSDYNENDYFNKECPEETSNWKELISFSWVQRILYVGYFRKDGLELNDISDLPERLKVKNTSKLLSDIDFNDPLPLIKHIYYQFLPRNYISIIFFIFISVFSFITPLFLKSFLNYVQDVKDKKNIYIGIGQSFLLFFSSFIYLLAQQYGAYFGMKTSLEVKGALEFIIFEKILKLSNASRKRYSYGSLINIISTDTDFFQSFFWHYHIEIFLFPIQILSLLGFLIYVVGISGFVGFMVMVITVPLSTFLGTCISKNLGISMEYSDSRINLTSELINGIRFLKQYAYEKMFIDRIEEQRKLQLKYLYKRIFYWILVQIITQASSGLVLVSTFTVYTLRGNYVTLEIAFTSITIFVNLRRPIESLPDCLHKFISLIAASKRIEAFLQSSEFHDQPLIHEKGSLNDILIKNSKFNWNNQHSEINKQQVYNIDMDSNKYSKLEEEEEEDYENIKLISFTNHQEIQSPITIINNSNANFIAPKGKLTIISSGVDINNNTTSLLSGLIGEIQLPDGTIELPNKISFTRLQPFLISGSIRENILFGKEMNMERYKMVLDACCLGPDLLCMAGKDHSEIGQRGYNLSKGQKHRISLARSLYADSDCYILDEILSFCDPQVANHLFDHCICGELMKDKTVILITHQIQFISSNVADHIVIVNSDGNIIQGSPQQLKSIGIDFESIVGEKEFEIEKSIKQLKIENDDDFYEDIYFNDLPDVNVSSSSSNSIKINKSSNSLPIGIPIESVISMDDDPTIIEKAKLFVKEEDKEIQTEDGIAGLKNMFKVYIKYIETGSSVPFFIITCFTYLIGQIIFLLSDVWLQSWASKSLDENLNQYSETYYLLSYLGFIGGFVFALGLRYLLITRITFGSAQVLHSRLLESVTNAKYSFFCQNPSGRILNRFSKDIGDVDIWLLDCFSDILYCGACLTTSIGIIIYITPYIAIPFAVLIALNWIFQMFYNHSVSELKRLESISRSPVFSLLSEVYDGLSTIRSFNQQDRFTRIMENNINIHLRLFFYSFAVSRWIGIRLELLSSLVVLMSALFSVFNDNPGLSALGVTTALSLTTYLNWFVRQFAELESKMNSVERIQSYIAIEPEQKQGIEQDSIETGFIWPPKGEIEFKNVEIKYKQGSEPALKNFSIKINPGEKIGIVGRSGTSGKSTIGVGLFRIIECSRGSIFIDGEDISKIGLSRLRSSIGIIPESPFLYSGSLRLNIDPFDMYTDEEIWDALEKVDLKQFVSMDLPMKLDSIIQENDVDGLSIGQKQLLCLCRAILKNSKIILLDEAISSVDVATSIQIKRTIEINFKDCTIITIAHRLNTIIESDRIAVMDNGSLVEFDTPLSLLSNPNSKFSNLIRNVNKNK